MYLFEGLKQKVLEYLPADRVQLVQESFVLAQEAHDGQMRSSGDPYITHPVAVAGILAGAIVSYRSYLDLNLAAALLGVALVFAALFSAATSSRAGQRGQTVFVVTPVAGKEVF